MMENHEQKPVFRMFFFVFHRVVFIVVHRF